MRISRSLAVLPCCILLAASGCSDRKADQGEVAADYVQTRTIHDLMVDVVQPQAEVFWNSAGAIIDEEGEHDLTPTTEEGWRATLASAATVTEFGNLLMTPPYSEGRGEDWMQFSRALVEVGLLAEEAVRSRDSEKMLEVGATMNNVCQACHQVYDGDVFPIGGMPEPEPADAASAE